MKTKVVNSPSNPTPYEYALLSRAAYYDTVEMLAETESWINEQLQKCGWRLEQSIAGANDYYGSIWVNDVSQQVVIAHRGSKNITSWITDYESVIKCKKGSFVRSAIDMLSHANVLRYEELGYRVSTTGHSLGGFLAQICVYWSKRREFQQSETRAASSTASASSSSDAQDILASGMAANISAVVFDSPGAFDFLQELQSNLIAEMESIHLPTLDIHNFCPQPTIVSTFGNQLGTMWHLGGVSPAVSLPFINAHRMEHFLSLFNQQTGEPLQKIQITDFPQVDYSALKNLPELLVDKTVQAAFGFMNFLYKKVTKKLFRRDESVPTWYEQLFSDPASDVSVALKNASMGDTSFAIVMNQAINGHYARLNDEQSQHSLPLYHFTAEVQDFLKHLADAKRLEFDRIGWNEQINNIYGAEDAAFLLNIRLEQRDNLCIVRFPSDYISGVFTAQIKLHGIIQTKGVVSTVDFFHEYVENKDKRLAEIENLLQGGSQATENLLKEQAEIRTQLSELTSNIEKLKEISPDKSAKSHLKLTTDGIILTKTGTTVTIEKGSADYDPVVKATNALTDIARMKAAAKYPGDVSLTLRCTEDQGGSNIINVVSTAAAAPQDPEERKHILSQLFQTLPKRKRSHHATNSQATGSLDGGVSLSPPKSPPRG